MLKKLKRKVSATRMTFLSVAAVVALGNTLTGWSVVSWILWVPPIALSLAAITGVCPFKIIFEKLGFANN
jgi:fatty acid desaturase